MSFLAGESAFRAQRVHVAVEATQRSQLRKIALERPSRLRPARLVPAHWPPGLGRQTTPSEQLAELAPALRRRCSQPAPRPAGRQAGGPRSDAAVLIEPTLGDVLNDAVRHQVPDRLPLADAMPAPGRGD